MAHRKKGKGSRPRRVGGRKSDMLTKVALRVGGVALGAVAGAFVVNAAKTAFPTAPLWAPPAAVAAAGAAIPHFVKNNPLAEGFGDGMLAIGAVMALNETALSVPGISGLAMYSNAGPANGILRQAVGGGALPSGYLNRTVGNLPNGRIITGRGKSMAMGALLSD